MIWSTSTNRRKPYWMRSHRYRRTIYFMLLASQKLNPTLVPNAVASKSHWRELCVDGWSALESQAKLLLAPLWLRGRRPAAGRNAAALDAHIWASNAGQDTTLDTLQQAVILIWVALNVSCFLFFTNGNGFTIKVVASLKCIVIHKAVWCSMLIEFWGPEVLSGRGLGDAGRRFREGVSFRTYECPLPLSLTRVFRYWIPADKIVCCLINHPNAHNMHHRSGGWGSN